MNRKLLLSSLFFCLCSCDTYLKIETKNKSFCQKNIDATEPDSIGLGTATEPYLICSSTQLNKIGLNSSLWDKSFKLMTDIDLSGVTWNMIGNNTTPFSGSFDGSLFKITNLTIENSTGANPTGFFQKTNGATIKNLQLENVNISGKNKSGALIGEAKNTNIDKIKLSGTVQAVGLFTGGLIGELNASSSLTTISNVISTASVSSTSNETGGLFGYLNGNGATANTTISNCASMGNVSGTDDVGGLVGFLWNFEKLNNYTIELKNSFASGNISGSIYSGGLIGYCAICSDISNLYFSGTSSGYGLIGVNTLFGYSGPIISENLYYDSNLNPAGDTDITGDPIPGAISLSTSQMKQQSSFVGFDFINIWQIQEGQSSPTLRQITF